MNLTNWASLAVNYDDMQHEIYFPVITQPKLNGIRAKWDHIEGVFVSRQGKVWKHKLFPHLYNKLELCPDVSFDGELYCHHMPFQDICARVSVNAVSAHPDVEKIDFFPFDIISSDDTISRQLLLEQSYPNIVPHTLAKSIEQLEQQLAGYIALGYEGLMIRISGCPYMPGRTKSLIKLKPWKYMTVKVTGMIEGKGKWANALGAINVKHEESGVTFCVGGGNITEQRRAELWKLDKNLIGAVVVVAYRELSKSKIPLQPKITKISL